MNSLIPVIAIVGRPNVGKSTLFNYLTRTRNALVVDLPGVTRDRQYGEGSYAGHSFILIDTGGVERTDSDLQALMYDQTFKAIEEANIIFWVLDARSGLTITDRHIAELLRPLKKTVFLLVNKSDGIEPSVACTDFYQLGWKYVYAIAAVQGAGVSAVLEVALNGAQNNMGNSGVDHAASLSAQTEVFQITNLSAQAEVSQKEEGIKVAIIGRPNVGKSTLVNRILGESRVLVYDAPGTTRDSIFIPLERQGKSYVLIDTAGVRRRRSVNQPLEKFSIVQTLQAIVEANVVVFIIDARENIADQDLHLLGFISEAGRALVIAVNKWDGLPETQRLAVRKELDRRLDFVSYARVHYISALHGSGVGKLFDAIQESYAASVQKLSTAQLTKILEQAVESHQPPLVQGRRIKLRYAHSGGSNPPVIVIHGNQTQKLPMSYQRYLANFYRKAFNLVGTPIQIELRSSANPFESKKKE